MQDAGAYSQRSSVPSSQGEVGVGLVKGDRGDEMYLLTEN